MARRADSTEAIGNALAAKSRGDGYRSIAARFGLPESTVRRWLRAVRGRTRSGCTAAAWTRPCS
jgi:transposase